MNAKRRLSASVDGHLLDAVEAAVSRGRSNSVSAWVNDALRRQIDHDRRLEALAAFVAAYEAEHGAITPAEMQRASRRARARATTVRGLGSAAARARRPRKTG